MKPQSENRQVVARLGLTNGQRGNSDVSKNLILQLRQETGQLQIVLRNFLRNSDRQGKSNGDRRDSRKELLALRLVIGRYNNVLSRIVSRLKASEELKAAQKPSATGLGERKLSPRELEIVHLLAESLTNKEVASRLGINVRTVETHRARIMLKLGLKSVAGLVRYAIHTNLLSRG
jgi:DNA-binding CsgD family transcriptional regulator